MVHYLIAKVLKFDTDYDNPERLHLMTQLKDMTIPYYTVFGKNMI